MLLPKYIKNRPFWEWPRAIHNFSVGLCYDGRCQNTVKFFCFTKRETFYTVAKGCRIMRADLYRPKPWCGTNQCPEEQYKMIQSILRTKEKKPRSYSLNICFLQYISLPVGHQSCPDKLKNNNINHMVIGQIHLAGIPYNIYSICSYTSTKIPISTLWIHLYRRRKTNSCDCWYLSTPFPQTNDRKNTY